MGLFVDKAASDADLEETITETLQADPADARDRVKVRQHVAAAKKAAEARSTFKWSRIIVGLLIGGGLMLLAIALSIYADNWAADQALQAATTPGYVAPSSSIPAIAASVMTLAAAWSAGLVAVLLSEKAS